MSGSYGEFVCCIHLPSDLLTTPHRACILQGASLCRIFIFESLLCAPYLTVRLKMVHERGMNRGILRILTGKLICTETITAVEYAYIRDCDCLRHHFCQFLFLCSVNSVFINFVIFTVVPILCRQPSCPVFFYQAFTLIASTNITFSLRGILASASRRLCFAISYRFIFFAKAEFCL